VSSITIVGGGIVGTSLAYHLRETDHDVTVLEKRNLGAGTTGKSIACFGWYPLYAGRDYDLATRSWNVYGPLIENGTISYHENGLLEIAETDAAFEELKESVETLQKRGRPAEVLAAEDVSEHGVAPEAVGAGAAFYPSVGRLDPSEIVSHFARAARNRGVDIETGVEVTDVHTDGREITGLATTAGDRPSDIVVNAAGPWAPQLNAMAGVSLPLKHSYAPISVLESPSDFDLPTVILESGLYFTGERSEKVLVGNAPHESTDENRWDAALELDDPDREQGTGMGSVGENHREIVARQTPRIVPELREAEISNEWRGIRCLTPDYRPAVGPTDVEGLYLATGMSGWGITLGPACGELLADHIENGTRSDELAYLSPTRFSDDD
jgi:sarcosine oxidase subunit beta